MSFNQSVFENSGLASTALGLAAAAGAQKAAAQSSPTSTQKTVVVGSGVRLNYIESGTGPTVVMVPGWSQSALQFKAQIDGLSSRYRVIAIDMRGHGDSDKPSNGYRIQRLAQDLQEALELLRLNDIILFGHSMGCSILWCHFQLYGSGRIKKYVFCDEPSFLTTSPSWTPQQIANYGSLFTPDAVSATCNLLRGPGALTISETFLRGLTTPTISPDFFQQILVQNLKMPRNYAADMLYNHCHQDWRDVLPRIDKPALLIGGDLSNVPVSSMRWNASQVPNSQLVVFTAAENGSHLMFMENPTKFNALLISYIG